MADTVSCAGQAENGRDGIALIDRLKPDIAIIDMQMPIMDGTALLPYLSEHYPDMPLVVISGYKDFDYVKHAMEAQAVDYVLKPFDRAAIQKTVQNAIGRLESKSRLENRLLSTEAQKEAAYYEYDIQLLKNLILGYHTENSAVRSNRLGYINHTHNLYLITLYYPKTPPAGELQQFLAENGFGDLALSISYTENPQIGFMVLFIPENPPLEPDLLIRQITDASLDWLELQGAPASAGISLEHTDLAQLKTAFQECSAALNMQPVRENRLRYQFYHAQKDPSFIHWEKQDEFLFRIEAGMCEEAGRLTEELFCYYLTIPGCTLGDAKYHCYLLSSLCRNILNLYFNQEIEADSSSMQNVITTIFSLEELKNYYRNFFMNISHLLENRNVYAIDDNIEKLKIYVERNYQKELSLEFISSLFYMNRSYLSHLFRQKTGCKYVDYVNTVRIGKAKELLCSSERKMYQIAKSVGYDNIKYFFRVFKKITGVTPVQYQEAHGIHPAESN